MELKFLLHSVPITLLQPQTGISNLTDTTGNNLHGFPWMWNAIFCTRLVSQMENSAAAKDTPGRDLE